MKLRLLVTTVLLFSTPPATTSARRHGRTLSPSTKTLSASTRSRSASTKKPAFLAGFLFLGFSISRLSALFLSRPHFLGALMLPVLIIQTPNRPVE